MATASFAFLLMSLACDGWAQTLSPVYRFMSLKDSGHFFTIQKSEADYIIANYSLVYVYEGPVFNASTTPAPGFTPVMRFWNYRTNEHLYSNSQLEVQYIQEHWPQYILEGVAYYAPPVPGSDGRIPLYRFWNQVVGDHFFTAALSEKDHIIATYPQFVYEGIAYYVYGASAPPGPPGNAAPSVSLSASATSVPVPGQVTLTATASDSDGQVVKVMFYEGANKLTEMTTTPYSYTANISVAGTYTYSAVAVDDKGATTSSAAVTVVASGAANQPPTVALAASSTTITAPGQVILTANAADSDGTVVVVSLYQSGVKLIDLTTPPYVYTATIAGAGTYQYTAQATDNKGATATSAVVTVTASGAPPPPPPSAAQDIYRLLNQATFGFTQAEAARVNGMGIPAWIDDQFTQPMSGYPDASYTYLSLVTSANCTNQDPVTKLGLPAADPRNICYRDNLTPTRVQRDFYTNAVSKPDQLRQRVAWALSQIHVISTVQGNLAIAYPMTRYQNILFQQAFGNFETLLNQITLSPSMGYWLTMVNNDKGNPATGRVANENYAREIMQLFSIGLVELNQDGTDMLDAQGQQIATYTQQDISEHAKIFTGWTYPKPGVVTTTKNPADYELPMVTYANGHDTGLKTMLPGPNQNIPANQSAQQDITDAVHNLFMHPNVGPFIGQQLIQHLVTSNPSPAYVSRVAGVFNNNGAGVRGDMKAVVKAILMDPEARGSAAPNTFGQLREPALMYTAILRGLGVATDGAGLSTRSGTLGQPIYSSPTVFNYYPIDYTIPNTALAGPEFGNHNSYTSVQRQNAVYSLVYQGIAVDATVPNAVGTIINTAPYQALAANPVAMVDALNQALLGGTLPANAATIIVNSVSQVPVANVVERARMAIYQMASSFHFQVQH